jgi:hypothetical protein
MTVVARLVTHADLAAPDPDPRSFSVTARLEAVLADGRRVVLLDDRGWGVSGGADVRAGLSTEEVAWTTRMVVGPDEPPDGMTHEQMAAGHWGHLAALLRRHGATVTAPNWNGCRTTSC